ncbi:MAG: hypothetical protein AB1768_15240 [Pseudomonadota bacterium]
MKTNAEYEIEYAQQQGRDAIAQARSTLESALQELERYATRFVEAQSAKEKANVLNWTLGYLATYIPSNIRLDMIATAQANLLRADAMQ